MSVAGVWNKLDTHSIIFLTWRIVATGFVAGCRKMMIFCHNIIYGSFCVYKVIKYCVEYLDYCDDAIIKKIFINTFNHALEFYTFRQMKKKVHKDWKLTSSPFVSYFQYVRNHQAYWNYNTMALQFEDVVDTIRALFGNTYNYIFYFDHSSGHDKTHPDAHNANEMNKLFGDKQGKMRYT